MQEGLIVVVVVVVDVELLKTGIEKERKKEHNGEDKEGTLLHCFPHFSKNSIMPIPCPPDHNSNPMELQFWINEGFI